MEVLPILLGGDLSAYGMALAFYEMGVRHSVALERYRAGVTAHTRLLTQICDERMKTDEGRLALICEIANKNKRKRPIVIGCTDEYAAFLIRCRERLPSEFIVPVPRASALRYADKAALAAACEVRGIPTPAAIYLRGDEEVPSALPFAYPAVLKPASAEEYWRHPFDGMKEVWLPRTAREAEGIRRRIRGAGYRGTLLLEERLTASDSDTYVLTAYSSRTGQVGAVAFGRVLLKDRSPRGLGAPAAILTMPPPPICRKIVSFLNGIGYCGFSNFDFVRPAGSREYYALGMNLHQGHSNHYMTAAGVNPASLLLRDYVSGGGAAPTCAVPDVFWHRVSPAAVYALLDDGALMGHLKALAGAGRSASLFDAEASEESLWRRLYLRMHEIWGGHRARRVAGESI